MAAIRGATGSSARAQSGSMISDKSRPGTEATLGHSADAATVKIDRATPGARAGAGTATRSAGNVPIYSARPTVTIERATQGY